MFHAPPFSRRCPPSPNSRHLAQNTAIALASPTTLVHKGKIWGTPAGDGGIQGAAGAGQCFNVALQRDLVQLDSKVSVSGGSARAGQDDVIVSGLSHIIFPAIDRFSARVNQRCSSKLNRSKTSVLAYGDLPEDTPRDLPRDGDIIDGLFQPSVEVFGWPIGSAAWVKWWLNQKIHTLVHSKEKACHLLQNDKQALWNLLSLSFSKKMDYLSALIYPTDFIQASRDFDDLVWSYLESATGLIIPQSDMGGGFECHLNLPINSLRGRLFQHHMVRLPQSKGGLGLRSVSDTSVPAFVGGVEMSLPFFTGDLGVAPALEEVIGCPDEGSVARWRDLINGNSITGREFAEAWAKSKLEAEECCNFLEDDISGTILAAKASSAGDGAEEGSTRTKVIQMIESLRHQSILAGLDRHQDWEAQPIKRFTQRDKVSQAWLSAL